MKLLFLYFGLRSFDIRAEYTAQVRNWKVASIPRVYRTWGTKGLQ